MTALNDGHAIDKTVDKETGALKSNLGGVLVHGLEKETQVETWAFALHKKDKMEKYKDAEFAMIEVNETWGGEQS